MSVKLRVHIAPVGFDFQRVTAPLQRMKADRVYLLTQGDRDNAAAYKKAVKTELDKSLPRIEVIEVSTDMWDLYACITKYRELFDKEKKGGNMISVNVSTGSKVVAIAGTIACMLWGGTPYYQEIEYEEHAHEVADQKVGTKILEVPVFPIKHPKDEYLLILDTIEGNKSQITKKQLIERLQEKGVVRTKNIDGTKDTTRASEQSQLRLLLSPMEHDFNYVTIESHGRRSIVRATKEGKDALRIFGLKQSSGQET